MTPLHTPPHLWEPYPDETAPRGGPIRCDNPPPEMRRIMRLANMRLGNTRLRTGPVTPAELSDELAAYRGR